MLSAPRHRWFALVAADMTIVTASYALAYAVRLDGHQFRSYLDQAFWHSLPWLLGIRFLCGLLVRQYTWAFRLASLSEALGLVKAAFVGTALFASLCFAADLPLRPPRSIFLLELGFSLTAIGTLRFLPRHLYQTYCQRRNRLATAGDDVLRTLIFGAGHTGELILRDLLHTRIHPYHVVGFVDDKAERWNTSIHGIRVLGPSRDLPVLIQKHRIDHILIAIPELPAERLREIVDVCSAFHVRYKRVPAYADLVAKGAAAPVMLKDVRPEDLLEREPVEFDTRAMADSLAGKTVLVTGAAGSIGSEICRQIAAHGIRKLIAFDLNENDLYFLQLELREAHPATDLHIAVGSVRDGVRLHAICERHRPHLVFHAAAHKHVPLLEPCPEEAIKNNILGTENTARAADACQAERFVLISTDKAVNPTNFMGASKRIAEFVVRRYDQQSQTRFMVVRFGNVLGSNGSLVQILQRQIAQGGPVTITHPKITRFFMTIPEAVGLVLIAALQVDGTVSVLDMGDPLKVDRLARELVALSGLIPDKDIQIVYTGLRPGEKMYEELFTQTEAHVPSGHPRIFLAEAKDLLPDLETMVRDAHAAVATATAEAAVDYLTRYAPDYRPVAQPAPGAPQG